MWVFSYTHNLSIFLALAEQTTDYKSAGAGIQINHRLKDLKNWAKELLTSEQGLKHRSQRPADVEQTFGNLKANKGFKRFLLRGLEKVEIEFGLLCISHNLAKYSVNMAK